MRIQGSMQQKPNSHGKYRGGAPDATRKKKAARALLTCALTIASLNVGGTAGMSKLISDIHSKTLNYVDVWCVQEHALGPQEMEAVKQTLAKRGYHCHATESYIQNKDGEARKGGAAIIVKKELRQGDAIEQTQDHAALAGKNNRGHCSSISIQPTA